MNRSVRARLTGLVVLVALLLGVIAASMHPRLKHLRRVSKGLVSEDQAP